MKHPPSIEVHGVTSPGELACANDLMAKTQAPSYWTAMAWLDSMGAGTPGFRLEHTRVAYVGGEMAGALRLQTAEVRIGKARWKTGGLGWVSTVPAFRNRGVCTTLMADAHAYMASNGYHAALLFGVPNLYHRYGYVVTLAGHTVTLQVPPLGRAEGPRSRTRLLHESDIPALRRMHDAQEETASCSMVRTTEDWKNQFRDAPAVTSFGPDWRHALGLLDGKDRLSAYFTAQRAKDALHIKEIGVRTADAHPALLNACFERARKEGFGKIVVHVAPYHSFARFLEAFDSLHINEHYRRRDGMMRLIDSGAALEAMVPEWEARLPETAARERPGRLALNVDGEAWRIESDGRRIGVHRGRNGSTAPCVGQGELLQWVTGFAYAEAWLAEHGKHWKPADKSLFRAIFPKRSPFVWPIDHF